MKVIKYISFGILLLVIWIPFAQMLFQVVESKGLKGAFVPHAKPEFSDSAWFTGDFQKGFEEYLNDTIGFHQDLIRLRNQVDYSFFDKCHSYDIEVGKNGYLVATWHIDAHLGKLRTRESRIDSLVSMMAQINDTLNKMNKTFIVLLAPSRGAFYKELAPAWYDLKPAHESDYQRYLRQLSKTKIRYIDFNKAFLNMKSTSKYPLYTKCGIHWSTYGATLAADSFVKYIEKERSIDLPDMKIENIELSKVARGVDADLNNTLNLIWDVKNDEMAYPKLSFNREGKGKTNLLSVGDSYYLGTLGSNVIASSFEENCFWYYNNTIWSSGPNNGKTTKDISFMHEIASHDVITIIATESTLTDFGWGFIEQAWNLLCKSDEEQVKLCMEKIRKDTTWYQQIEQKAKANNIDVNEQLRQDAKYTVDLEKQKK